MLRVSSLFIILAIISTLAHTLNYSILEINYNTDKTVLNILHAPLSNIILSNGKNIIPSGRYVFIHSKKNFQTVTNNILLKPGEKQSITIELLPAKFDLVINTTAPDYLLYLNSKLLLHANDTNITIKNIPGGIHDIFLLNKHKIFFTRINSIISEHRIIQATFIDIKKRTKLTTISSIIPGINLFFHRPESMRFSLTMGPFVFSLANSWLIYNIYIQKKNKKNYLTQEESGADIYALTSLNTIIANQKKKIRVTSGVIAALSLFNIFSAYNGIKNDFEEILKSNNISLSLNNNDYQFLISHKF